MINKVFVRLALITCIGVVSATSVGASTVTGVIPVTSTTVNACIVAATPLVFGTVNLIGGSANDSTATVTVTCTPGTTYNVGLDNGTNFLTGVRRMKSATTANYVPYRLYSDTNHTTPWNNTIGTDTVPGTSTAIPTLLTVYGRIAAGTTPVAADVYLDTVTVTVTY